MQIPDTDDPIWLVDRHGISVVCSDEQLRELSSVDGIYTSFEGE